MTGSDDTQTRFLEALGRPWSGAELFDRIADTVYFVKDAAGRYVLVNQTLVERCGLRDKTDLIGRTALDVFPAALGARIADQDHAVIAGGKSISRQLELHLYAGGGEGWCLTWKEPVLADDGRIVGLSGISRDLQPQSGNTTAMASVSLVLEHIHENLDQPLRADDLARLSDLSAYQLDHRIRSLFGVSLGQYVTRARIELACNRLRQSGQPISHIAQDCGYGDQAAFTRQFRRSVGLTPKAYRDRTGS